MGAGTAGCGARAARGVCGRVLRASIRGYQLLISPVLGPRCRYLPTCSEYALESVDRHGALRGGLLALRRIARCHPWGGHGYDPVPPVGAGRQCAGDGPA